MSDENPKTYRVTIRTMGGSMLGDWEPTWTIFQFDVALADIPELVADVVCAIDDADMEIVDDIARPPASLWKGYAAAFDMEQLATA